MVRELLVKANNLSHSGLLNIFSFLKLQAIFAPTGYPTNYSHDKGKGSFSTNIKDRFHKDIKYFT